MPHGDWHPNASMRPGIINIHVSKDGAVHHVGVGFEVLSPNGNVLTTRGWTWDMPDEHRPHLERVLRALVEEAAKDEGLAGVVYREFPDHGLTPAEVARLSRQPQPNPPAH